MRGHISNPAHSVISSKRPSMAYNHKRITPPFSVRIENYLKQLKIYRPIILNEFSYMLSKIKVPSYSIIPPEIDTSLTLYKKSEVAHGEFRCLFKELVN